MPSVSRVTQAGVHRTALQGLQDNLGRLQRLQGQLSSGRQVSRPSDSPVATVTAMQYRSEVRRTEQYARSAQDGLNWLGTADDTLTGMLGVARRARELTMLGMNGAISDESRQALAAEVDALRQNAIGLANTRYLDRPIFAGNADVDAAYDTTGTFVPGAIGPQPVERRVAPGVTVRVNLTGPEVFGPPGTDLFADLAAIADHLRSDASGLTGDLQALDARMLGVQNQLSKLGAVYRQVEDLRTRADHNVQTLRSGLSEVEDVDVAKAVVDLQLQEMAYRSALSATGRVIQPSLLDFLR